MRLRVNGSGDLQLFLKSLDDIREYETVGIPMLAVTNREPVVLSNFREQRAYVHGFVDTIDEVFNISKIIVFITPVATGYPQ